MASTTTNLAAPVTDGKIETSTTSTSKSKSSGSQMGKDEFLQLLVAQMKYQDPLEPTNNTEYVSQLATFSSLEQMQNLNQTSVNSQAFGLVGQEVIMKTITSAGKTSYTQGTVDYVTMSGNKTYLSIDGSLYSSEDLYSVIGNDYVVSQKVPTVTKTALTYNHSTPKDQVVEISLGEDNYEASAVVVYLNGSVVSSDKLSYADGKITISKDAFSGLDAGEYKLGFVFNDIMTTTYANKVTVRIIGIKPNTGGDNSGGTGKTDGTDSTDGTASGGNADIFDASETGTA